MGGQSRSAVGTVKRLHDQGVTVDVSVGVSDGTIISKVGICVGVGVGDGDGVSVGVDGGGVAVGRLRFNVTRLSTSALSPTRVKRKVTIPFGMAVRSHVKSVPSFTGLSLSLKTDHEPGSPPRPYSKIHFLNPLSAAADPLISKTVDVMT